jgi:hypothetical protein
MLICDFSARFNSQFLSCHFPVDKEEEKHKLQSLMACGKIIPPTPVHKTHLAPKANVSTPQHVDRFAECK